MGSAPPRSEADLESGRFDGLLGRFDGAVGRFDGWLWLPDALLLEPVEQRCGERGVIAATVVQEGAGVDQSFWCDLVAGGPGLPDVERADGHLGCGEAPVEAIEFLGELSLRLGVSTEAGVFGEEFVAFTGQPLC